MTIEDIPADMIVTINDLRTHHHCVTGTRLWFKTNGLDFRDFLKNGINAREFAAIDSLSEAVVSRMLADG